MNLRLKKVVNSTNDSTIKFIFYTEDNLVIEYSYINKKDGKDIICVPSQTMCSIGCKFCHTTEYIGKIKVRNLTSIEIADGVEYIYNHLKLSETPRTLLISFMGCGEPIYNVDSVIGSMLKIKDSLHNIYVRYAIATSLPKVKYVEFFKLVSEIDKNKLPVKLHISLHYTLDEMRWEWMPHSLDISSTISAAEFFKIKTGNPVEVHYALLDGINDTEQDAIILTNIVKSNGFNVKFLFYNKKDNIHVEPSDLKKLDTFIKHFNKYNIPHEYYIPPGLDIGASCGQFLMNEYL